MTECRNWRPRLAECVLMAGTGLLAGLVAASPSMSQTTRVTPEVEVVEDDRGALAAFAETIKVFQRRANAEIATYMKAIEHGDDLGAFFLGLAIAFAYGIFHAFGPGHGKFIIISYFLGREARVARGVVMALQVAIVHVIAAIVIVWLADIVLKAGFGIGLSEVPGVRAASFLIIVGIGLYMLYRAARTAGSPVSGVTVGDGHDHGREHSHSHGADPGGDHDHGRGDGGNLEGGLLALAAGMVPCPGAVLIMLYAVANDMIYPGFMLVGAMSLGIGLSICVVGVGAILARQAATRFMERSGGSRGAAVLRTTLNYAGATFVTLVGLVSFIAFLDVPLG